MYQKFASIYDLFMEHCDYNSWKQQIYDILEENNIKKGKLLDIGCGTGELLLRIYDKYEVSGLDISPEMLSIAKKKLDCFNVKLYEENMLDFDLSEKFNVIIALFDTVNHIIKYEDLIKHLETVKKHLEEEGIYIFDLVNRKFMDEMFFGGSFIDKREKIITIWEHSKLGDIDCIDATYFVKEKNGYYKKLEEVYMKKIFSDNDIIEAAEIVGLEYVSKIINSDIAGERSFIVLKKRG